MQKRCDSSDSQGVLRVVGFGPGSIEDRTHRAETAILGSEYIVGYGPYLKRIEDLLEGKKQYVSGMKKERERVLEAVELAENGHSVALVSSGDAGIYGMAGLAIQIRGERQSTFPVEIIPGVTAACTAAAKLGAPLMLDYATISLSNLLVKWDVIEKRLHAALSGDFALAVYNPKSNTRTEPFDNLCKIAREYLPDTTPVGIATALGQPDEFVEIVTLGELPTATVTMKSILIIGNSTSCLDSGFFITPRGY